MYLVEKFVKNQGKREAFCKSFFFKYNIYKKIRNFNEEFTKSLFNFSRSFLCPLVCESNFVLKLPGADCASSNI